MKPRREYYSQYIWFAILLLTIGLFFVVVPEFGIVLVLWFIALTIQREWERSERIPNRRALSSRGLTCREAMMCISLVFIVVGIAAIEISIQIGIMFTIHFTLSLIYLFFIGWQERRDSEVSRGSQRRKKPPLARKDPIYQEKICPSCNELVWISPTKEDTRCTNCGYDLSVYSDRLFEEIEEVSDEELDDSWLND